MVKHPTASNRITRRFPFDRFMGGSGDPEGSDPEGGVKR
jgi:hypothetical protein